MLRIILGAAVGFVAWSILWVGSDALLAVVSPGWYGKSLVDLQTAVENKTDYTADSALLLLGLARSVIFSLAAGFLAALVSRESIKAPLAAGFLLLLFGVFIQSIYWHYVPLWYHLPFLLLLVPVAFIGGQLKRQRLLV